jgi:hypothetical protein
MNENEEDVVHAGIISKSQKPPEFRPILEFATDRRIPLMANGRMGGMPFLAQPFQGRLPTKLSGSELMEGHETK